MKKVGRRRSSHVMMNPDIPACILWKQVQEVFGLEYYHIEGGVPLRGEYQVKGAKNAALPILAATVCKGGVHEIYGCPRIEDALALTQILEALGAKIRWERDCVVVDSRNVSESAVPQHLMEKLRSSVFLLGSLLARTGEATVYRPGGCKIGKRPIDIHINGLSQLGFEVMEDEEKVTCRGRCRGGRIVLPYPSVGATENLMMAALSGTADTIIENCAAEPEIVDLQGFLRSCGFQVYGAGTSTICIQGGAGRNDSMYFIMEDRIEAATYLMALAGTGGEGMLTNVHPVFLQAVLDVLERMGFRLDCYEDCIALKQPVGNGMEGRARGSVGNMMQSGMMRGGVAQDGMMQGGTVGFGAAGGAAGRFKSPGIIVTAPYPGFPTDCQPQLLTLATGAEGLTTIREEIFDSRFTHKKDLMKMGANIETCGKNAIIKGMRSLQGCRTKALDLRGGAALVLAGLMAEGKTIVEDIHHIERGYEDLDGGLRSLGGRIEKRKTKEENESAGEAACAASADGRGDCGAVAARF